MNPYIIDQVEYFGVARDLSLNLLQIGVDDLDLLEIVQSKVSCIGIEQSEPRYKEVCKCSDEGTPIYLMNYAKIGFTDNWFDYVVSLYTPAEMKDFKPLFREVRRVLKDSGRFMFALPNELVAAGTYLHRVDDEEWKVRIASVGLIVERSRRIGSTTLFVGRVSK